MLRRIRGRARSAGLISELSHDDWLALVIEDIEGRHPEPSDVTRIVDWPWACVGCRWFDALTYLLELRRIGADVDTERLTSEHPIFADVEPAAVTAVLCALAGTFLDRARRPAPPAMPTLRAFQRDEGEASLAWVRARVERRPVVF